MQEFRHKNCQVVLDEEFTISVFPTSPHQKPFKITFDFTGEVSEVFHKAKHMKYPLAFLRKVAKNQKSDASENYYRGDYPYVRPWERGYWHKGQWIPKHGR